MSLDPVGLAAVGDLMLGDSAICTGYGFASRYPNLRSCRPVRQLTPLFEQADVVFGNLESVISSAGHDPTDWASTQMRGRPFYARLLRDLGFTVVSVANNHAFQHGLEAFDETVTLLRDEGIACCGLRGEGGWTSKPALLSTKGRTLGFLAYCLRPRQYSQAVPPYAEGAPDDIVSDVTKLKAEVDHVILSLHWGEEYVCTPSDTEVHLGRRLIDAGASVLLGHHPHVPRAVEYWEEGIIAYSLGNFISDMIWYQPLREAVVVSAELGTKPLNVRVKKLTLTDSYVPDADHPVTIEITSEAVKGIPDHEYRRAVTRTVRAQRLASYLHALRNRSSFQGSTFRQLLQRTLNNKWLALRTGLSRSRQGAPS